MDGSLCCRQGMYAFIMHLSSGAGAAAAAALGLLAAACAVAVPACFTAPAADEPADTAARVAQSCA